MKNDTSVRLIGDGFAKIKFQLTQHPPEFVCDFLAYILFFRVVFSQKHDSILNL
jgi:hypothetical protein